MYEGSSAVPARAAKPQYSPQYPTAPAAATACDTATRIKSAGRLAHFPFGARIKPGGRKEPAKASTHDDEGS